MSDLIGVGLYDRREASRLTGTKSEAIRRWLAGYERAGVRYEPLWEPLLSTGEELVLDFRDLMELRAVTTLTSRKSPKGARIGIRTMRKAIQLAAARFGASRPLSTLRFKTDGARIFFEDLEAAEGEPPIEDLFTGQKQMRSVIEQTLHDIDFDGDLPHIWWPLGRRGGIIVDPARSFGQPIEAETSIQTSTLAMAAEVEGGIIEAARLYEVPQRAVKRAVTFENRFLQAA